MTVTILMNPVWRKLSEKNNRPIVLLFNYPKDWPDRIIKHRGWQKWKEVASRKMTDVERKSYQETYRGSSFSYENWESLIEDELEICNDQSWISEIKQLKKQYTIYSELS